MKESYIKLPNITVNKLQEVVDYLDENNIEYIEEYKRDEEINRLYEIIDKAKIYIKEHSTTIDYKTMKADYNLNMNDLLNILKGDNK